MEKKITKKEFYAAIRTMVEGVDMVGEIPADEVLAFIDKTVEQIDNKAAKAKEKAAEKKADGDALRETVLANVTGEFQTAADITTAIGDEEISKSKVVARLTQLVNAGLVKKEQMKVGDSKLMCYALVDAE
jgi:hypothetical protein